MNFNTKHLFLRIAVIMGIILAGSISYSFADDGEYLSPRKQVESGVAPEDIQCKENRVLVLRTNGSPVCVTEKTAEKTGWEIIIKEKATKLDISQETIVTQKSVTTPKVTVLDYSSPTAFVDDGREYPKASQRSPPPQDAYDRIMDASYFDVDNNGVATFTSVSHEKYSLNPQKGFYVEDWIPTFIPEGQKLLYGATFYQTFDVNGKTYENYVGGAKFTPPTFELTPDITTRDLKKSKGFTVSVKYSTLPHDEIEDYIEFIKDSREGRSDNYGGFREMTRDGKTVMAFAGGNGNNPYQATITFHPDEFTSVGVLSNYHTLDELIPIFNSVMK